ncbi:MAG: glycosyltransferase [Parachlamydiaceae bacterium]|nr:glycosyltransferase [Parachlamydiaceae bacterium]
MSKILEDYMKIVGQTPIDQLLQLAKPLAQIKIVHVNSTKMGGGVAEILTKMIPLTHNLGIANCSWEIIQGTEEFFNCTKDFHNALQGNKIMPSKAHLETFLSINAENALRLRPILEDADIVFIHDPQPLPLIEHFPDRKGKWIWRCHIDASEPYPPVWSFLKPYIEKYDATIFSLAEFSHPLVNPMFVILPSIDPLSEKNIDLTDSEIKEKIEFFGVDPHRPIFLQVSRFDRFKDPLGVIKSYQLVKKYNPSVQLILAGSGATDDPEGDIVLNEVMMASQDDPSIHVLLLPADAARTINALQRAADIIIQKSTKEGFGLTVTEGLWKEKPVIGGNVGGIRKQIINWHSGFLVNTPEGAAYRMRYLLQNKDKMQEMGRIGKEYVRENFLITRHLREYLTLIYSLYFQKSGRIELYTEVRPNFGFWQRESSRD